MTGLQALVVDFGGVLTSDLSGAMAVWLAADDIDPAQFRSVMREWLTPGAPSNPVHGLETGALPGPEFERALAARLTDRAGAPVVADGLLQRMFSAFAAEPDMYALLARARSAGIRTALLSNSWGNTYPVEELAPLFDLQVISGEVGLRKPDPAIYRLTAERLGLPPSACVFVDDLGPNVRAAAEVGMVGVRHVDAATTIAEVEALFDWPAAG